MNESASNLSVVEAKTMIEKSSSKLSSKLSLFEANIQKNSRSRSRSFITNAAQNISRHPVAHPGTRRVRRFSQHKTAPSTSRPSLSKVSTEGSLRSLMTESTWSLTEASSRSFDTSMSSFSNAGWASMSSFSNARWALPEGSASAESASNRSLSNSMLNRVARFENTKPARPNVISISCDIESNVQKNGFVPKEAGTNKAFSSRPPVAPVTAPVTSTKEHQRVAPQRQLRPSVVNSSMNDSVQSFLTEPSTRSEGSNKPSVSSSLMNRIALFENPKSERPTVISIDSGNIDLETDDPSSSFHQDSLYAEEGHHETHVSERNSSQGNKAGSNSFSSLRGSSFDDIVSDDSGHHKGFRRLSSLRPGVVRGNSFGQTNHVLYSESEDEDCHDTEVPRHVSSLRRLPSLRPARSRGNSIDETTVSLESENEDNDEDFSRLSSLRPGVMRGNSFGDPDTINGAYSDESDDDGYYPSDELSHRFSSLRRLPSLRLGRSRGCSIDDTSTISHESSEGNKVGHSRIRVPCRFSTSLRPGVMRGNSFGDTTASFDETINVLYGETDDEFHDKEASRPFDESTNGSAFDGSATRPQGFF